MTIDEVYKFIDFIIKKSNAGGYLSPDEFNLIINRAQIQYFNKLYGNQNDYRYDRPVPKISYAVTEKIANSLSPFLISQSVTSDVNGQVPVPNSLFQTVSFAIRVDGTPYEVTRVEHDRVANNMTSYYDAPDQYFPIYTQSSDKFQFYPSTSGQVYDFKYLEAPQNMTWAYTISNGRPVYAPSATGSGVFPSTGSVQPKWKDMDMNEIIYLALSYIGINLKDGEVEQFANMKTQTGL